MIRINSVKLRLDYNDRDLTAIAAKILNISPKLIESAKLHRLSTDARSKRDVHYIAAVDVLLKNGEDENGIAEKCGCKQAAVVHDLPFVFMKSRAADKKIAIIGAGPCGLFCAYNLAKAGIAPIIIERGAQVEKRVRDVENFEKNGVLNTDSNIQFGEGGAGTFSDGKLNTGIKDERIRHVLETFVKFGAPSEILYLAKPHIGTDILRRVIVNMRNEIIALGGEFRFDTKLCGINESGGRVKSVILNHDSSKYEMQCDDVVLAIGHSARDTFEFLRDMGVDMEQKPFSIGVRIEHLQSMINSSQYGKFAENARLKAADYKLAVHLPNGRGAYTFCMCPGGYVSAAASEHGGVVTNGMSNHSRNGKNANAALLVGITPQDFGGSDVLSGVNLQREIEQRAFKAGGENYRAPAQTVGSFLHGFDNKIGNVSPTYPLGVTLCDIAPIFPDFITESLKIGIELMDKKLHGFASQDAILTAPETRSSSPVRILRDDTMQSSLKGVYPCGEGAGYAGGITSSAVDGVKCAQSIIKKYNSAE